MRATRMGTRRKNMFLQFSLIRFLSLGLFLLVACLIVGALVSNPVISYATMESFDGQLVRYVPEQGQDTMIVVKNLSTGRNETFDNQDSLWLWKWNSRDLYALDEGKNYRFKVNWFRNGFFSQSRNIISATPLDQ